MRVRTGSVAAAALAVVAVVLVLPALAAELGEPVRFSKGRPVTAGPLTIEYVGERHVSHPVFKPGFTFHDFKVSDGRETKTISWSSGTGEVGPQEFALSGTKYQLELRHSIARAGWLRDDELVLWRDVDFQKAAAARQKR
jgi:hypothetical protein